MAIEVAAQITGTVWRIEKRLGENVVKGDVLLVLESMKMELPVQAPAGGRLKELRCREAQAVSEGDVVAVLE